MLFSARDAVPNEALDAVLQKELERVGPPAFDAHDLAFAQAMQKELGRRAGRDGGRRCMPYAVKNGGTASSDIGEVSAVVPLAELNVATRPLGTAAHHWAQTSCAAHPVGFKGMRDRGQGARRVGSGPARGSGDGGRRESRLPEGHRRKAVPVASAGGREAAGEPLSLHAGNDLDRFRVALRRTASGGPLTRPSLRRGRGRADALPVAICPSRAVVGPRPSRSVTLVLDGEAPLRSQSARPSRRAPGGSARDPAAAW